MHVNNKSNASSIRFGVIEAHIFGESKLKRKPKCLVYTVLDLSILEDACVANFKSKIYGLGCRYVNKQT